MPAPMHPVPRRLRDRTSRAGEKFFVELVGKDYLLTDATTGLNMRVLLDGFHSVPVN
jgi:D-lyxose ketol-isomerase